MPLDPYLAAKIDLLDGVTDWDQAQSDPQTLTRLMEFFADPGAWSMPEIAVDDCTIPGPHGEIPVRIYRPGVEPESALLWLHGGGFTGGDLNMPEAHLVSAELAARAGALVVSADHRLAVEGVHYPVPVDDAHATWLWLADSLWPGGGPIALGGASAGSALALSVALRLREQGRRLPDNLILAYPFAHFPVPALGAHSAEEIAQLPPLLRFTPESIEQMVRNYVGRISALPPDALPGAADLAGLPRTSIMLSEYDDLRPSGELLARQLTESGVPVETYLSVGMPHGHLNRTPALDEVDRSLAFFAKALAR
jgi:acetyl esterase